MDITERLSNWAQYATTGQKLVIIDAKNEIERLREALWKIVKVKYYGEEGGYMESDEMRDIARSALQQKENK